MGASSSLREVENAILDSRAAILDRLSRVTGGDYKTNWLRLQESVLEVVVGRLSRLPGIRVKRTIVKNKFPDLEILGDGFVVAVDVKSGGSSHAWWDIARLDTIEEKRLAKFPKEFDVVVMYDQKAMRVVEVSILEMYQTVGRKGDDLLYRPYDGKIRPKPWEVFKEGRSLWASEAEFREALVRTKFNRRRRLILEWIEDLPEPMRAEVRTRLGP